MPHTSIDTQAHWTKSGWHGWVYGWKLHLTMAVFDQVWLPLAVVITPANAFDGETAPPLLAELPPEVRFVLEDKHYNRDDLQLRSVANENFDELFKSMFDILPLSSDLSIHNATL